MNDAKARASEMIEELKKQRDELKVKLHLAKLEAGDEWEVLEAKLAKLESKARELGEATGEASQNVGAAMKLLGQEIKDGLKDIARHF
jgi:hypothetical protein